MGHWSTAVYSNVRCSGHSDTKTCPPTPSHLSSSTWKRSGVWM